MESLFNKSEKTQAFSREHCEIFTNSFCYITPQVASVDVLFLIKNNVGWFLLKRFVDLVRVRYLQIISRNRSNMLLLISPQKTGICPKKNTALKAICSDIRILKM